MRRCRPAQPGAATERDPDPVPLVGGYGTIATGVASPIFSPVPSMHSKSAPKYGSGEERRAHQLHHASAREPVLLHHRRNEDVEVAASPEPLAFIHANHG